MWTLQDAKNRFSAVVDAALAGTPQQVSRRGKPAVVVVSAAAYAELLAQARQARGPFLDHLIAFPCEPVGRAEGKVSQIKPRDVSF
jgi:antitoxin Phd